MQPRFIPEEITVLKFTPKRTVDPSPIGYSYLVTARSAVPSPRESCSLVTARISVPSPRESCSLVTARSANPSPRESCSQVIARSAVPSPRESGSPLSSGRATNPNSNPPSPSRVSASSAHPEHPQMSAHPEHPQVPSPLPECNLDLGFVTELNQEPFSVPISGTALVLVQEYIPRNAVPKPV